MGKDDNVEDGSNEVIIADGFGSSFFTKEIRAKFIRKVYAILLSQLAVTICFIAIFIFTPAIKNFYCDQTFEDVHGIVHCMAASHNGFVVYVVSYVVFFVTFFTIVCCDSIRRKSPGNIVAMAVFTLALSLWVSSMAVYHDAIWVMMAIGITAAICLGLTLFSFQTKIDFTGFGIYLFAASWILFLFGLLAIIFWAYKYPVISTVYSALTALLFSGFLIYDTQQIMGGKKYSISPEEYIYASIQLYVDVVYIFLSIMNLQR